MTSTSHPSGAVLLAEAVRDGLVESRHYGSGVVCRDGCLVYAAGAIEQPVYWRSSEKPFQALALVESGAIERFGLGEKHLALACGSIDANEEQVALVLEMLASGGLTENDLGCPLSEPKNSAARDRAHGRGEKKRRAFHMCAGKHSGMLLAAKAMGATTKDYLDPHHPVQTLIRANLERIMGSAASHETRQCGGDGCGAPVVAATLVEIARAFSRLVKPDNGIAPDVAKRLERISAAMAKYPEMVGGDSARIDSEIMRTGAGDLVAKSGAEALLCIARRSDGTAVILKAEDGFDRGLRPAAIAWLKMTGLLPDELPGSFTQYERAPLTSAEKVVGEVRYAGPRIG